MLHAHKMKTLSIVPNELLDEAAKVSQKVLSLEAWSRMLEKSARQLSNFLATRTDGNDVQPVVAPANDPPRVSEREEAKFEDEEEDDAEASEPVITPPSNPGVANEVELPPNNPFVVSKIGKKDRSEEDVSISADDSRVSHNRVLHQQEQELEPPRVEPTVMSLEVTRVSDAKEQSSTGRIHQGQIPVIPLLEQIRPHLFKKRAQVKQLSSLEIQTHAPMFQHN